MPKDESASDGVKSRRNTGIRITILALMGLAVIVGSFKTRARAASGQSVSGGSIRYLDPVELKFSPDGSRLYVVCEGDDSLLAIDVNMHRVIAKARVGHVPRGLTVSPDGRSVFVSNEWNDTVSELDAGSLAVRRVLKTGWGPVGLTIDRAGRTLYVANSIGGDISLIDLRKGGEIKRLAASRSPHHLALSRDGKKVYVSNLLPRLALPDASPISELTVLDTAKQAVAERIPIPGVVELRHIAEVPAERGGYLLIPFMRPKNLNPLVQVAQGWIITHGVAIVRRDPGEVTHTVSQVLLDDIDYYFAGLNGVAITPDGRFILVTASEADVVTIIDAAKLDTFLRYASGDQLANRLDSAAKFVIRRLPTGSNPQAAIVSPDGRFAYIANRLSDTLTVVDLSQLAVASTIDLGGPKEITRLRRGERLFHDASYCFQGQFACATCHPNNHIDGLAWNLETPELGRDRVLNRTLRGIAETAPYKWNGHNPDLETQCGPRIAKFLFHSEGFAPEQLADLVAYLKSIPLPPNRHLDASGRLTPAQERGKRIFFAKQCDICHTPETHYTSRTSRDVGSTTRFDTSGTLDVPHLDRLYERPPYMHGGQALSLEEIWTKFNANDRHGFTSNMSKDELNDLIEYLKTL